MNYFYNKIIETTVDYVTGTNNNEEIPVIEENAIVPYDPDQIPSAIKIMELCYRILKAVFGAKFNFFTKSIDGTSYAETASRHYSRASRSDFENLHIVDCLLSLPLWYEKKSRGAIALAGSCKYIAEALVITKKLYKKLEGNKFTPSKEAPYNRVIWVLNDFYNENCCNEDAYQKLEHVPQVNNNNNDNIVEEQEELLPTYQIQRACCSVNELEMIREIFDEYASKKPLPNNQEIENLFSIVNKIENKYERTLTECKLYRRHHYEHLSEFFIEKIYPIVKTDNNPIPERYLIKFQKE